MKVQWNKIDSDPADRRQPTAVSSGFLRTCDTTWDTADNCCCINSQKAGIVSALVYCRDAPSLSRASTAAVLPRTPGFFGEFSIHPIIHHRIESAHKFEPAETSKFLHADTYHTPYAYTYLILPDTNFFVPFPMASISLVSLSVTRDFANVCEYILVYIYI